MKRFQFSVGRTLDLNQEIEAIIKSIPEITQEFDRPDYVFIRKPNINKPMEARIEKKSCLSHQDLANFCNICVRNFENPWKFDQHFQVHQREPVCYICKLNFTTNTNLQQHLQESHKTICEFCGEAVPTLQLKMHQNKKMDHKLISVDYLNSCLINSISPISH